MNQSLLRQLVELKDGVVPALFKPVQFNILKKLSVGKKLTENEQRYLRGNMKSKLNILMRLMESKPREVGRDIAVLESLGSYYITGLEALKHNGYGWYFKPKRIEVINTKIEGSMKFADKIVQCIRVKSIKHSRFSIDKKTGLKYATNEQIIKDIRRIKNEYTERVWKQMLSRYGNLFVKNKQQFKTYLQEDQTVDYAVYGV
jgi:hypothetical protein